MLKIILQCKYIFNFHPCFVVVYDAISGNIVTKLKGAHNRCVRDVSWHPYENTIISSSVSSALCLPRLFGIFSEFREIFFLQNPLNFSFFLLRFLKLTLSKTVTNGFAPRSMPGISLCNSKLLLSV